MKKFYNNGPIFEPFKSYKSKFYNNGPRFDPFKSYQQKSFIMMAPGAVFTILLFLHNLRINSLRLYLPARDRQSRVFDPFVKLNIKKFYNNGPIFEPLKSYKSKFYNNGQRFDPF
jgi:hypothetical protein